MNTDRPVTFESISPPVIANYSCAVDQRSIEKVLLKGDWCLTIVRNTNDRTYTVYGHWPELRLNFGSWDNLNKARTGAIIGARSILKMLNKKAHLAHPAIDEPVLPVPKAPSAFSSCWSKIMGRLRRRL